MSAAAVVLQEAVFSLLAADAPLTTLTVLGLAISES